MFPVMARVGGSSDADCLCQIFVDCQYAPLCDIDSPRLILDLGANVGYASAFFLSRFPSAKLMAVEPDPGNFEICRRNLSPYGERAMVLRGAVWSRRSRLVLSRNFGDRRDWAIQVREYADGDKEATVEGWDVENLLEMAGEKYVDLLKVDIERGELEVFGSTCAPWLPRVRNICIELHGPDCEQAFLNALRDYDYDLSTAGELTICRNLRLKSPYQSRTPNDTAPCVAGYQ
jgi:FkbM family methyltransferase